MLNKKYQILIKSINSKVPDDSYKVIEITEFLEDFKNKHKVSEKELFEMMTYLQKNFFIDIKYTDPQVYCLSVKPKLRNYKSKEVETFISNKEMRKFKKLFLFYAILAGLCSFVGTGLAILVFLK